MNKRYVPYVLLFVLFTIIRAIPEIQAGDLPAGWDSINYYSPWTIAYAKHGILNEHFLGAPPLIYVLTISLYLLTSSIWLSIKMLAPILYGILGLSIFHFARSYISWNVKKSVLCSLLLMCQPAALRISWDLLKNELAIALLFLQMSLIYLASKKSDRKLTFLILVLSILIVFSHQYVTVIYFAILLGILLSKTSTKTFKRHLLSISIPAFALFFIITGIYAEWNIPLISTPKDETHFHIIIHYVDYPTFSFFKDYLLKYNSHSILFAETMVLFFLLYSFILPLAIFGFWHDQFLTPFLIFSLIVSFLPLVSPRLAIADFERWMYMLTYVFPFYATNSIFKLTLSFPALPNNGHNIKILSRLTRRILENKTMIIYTLFLVTFSLGYTFGAVRPFFRPIETYVPTALSDKPISSTSFQEITTNINWLNNQYRNHSTLEFYDHFEGLSSNWHYEGNGDFVLESSMITINTTRDSGICSLSTNLSMNYLGTMEVKFKFNGFTEGSQFLDVLTIHRLSGYGGYVVYFYNNISCWDSENNTSYNLAPLDENWHVLKVTFNGTCTLMSIDGLDKLYIERREFFGQIALGQRENHQYYGGSSSIDYITIEGNVEPIFTLICSFRELGIVWINLDESIEIVSFMGDLDKALSFAENEPNNRVFMLLPTDYKVKFVLLHGMQHYSIFTLES